MMVSYNIKVFIIGDCFIIIHFTLNPQEDKGCGSDPDYQSRDIQETICFVPENDPDRFSYIHGDFF